MKTISMLLAILLYFAILQQKTMAQPNHNQQNNDEADSTEIILHIKNGINKNTFEIKNGNLRSTLARYGITGLKKAYPNFNEADTLHTLPNGKKVRMENYANYYKATLRQKKQSSQLIYELHKIRDVIFASENAEFNGKLRGKKP